MEKNQKPLIGQRIEARLAELGKSQKWLAENIGVTQTAISQIISRGASKKFPDIAAALGINYDWLISGHGPMINLQYKQPARNSGLEDVPRQSKREKILDLLDEFCKLSPLEQEKLMILQDLEKKEPPSVDGIHNGERTNKGHK